MGASLLGNIVVGKGLIRADKGTHRARESFLILLCPLSNIKIQRCYQNESNLLGFIEEIITDYKGWSRCNKSCWIRW